MFVDDGRGGGGLKSKLDVESLSNDHQMIGGRMIYVERVCGAWPSHRCR